MVPQMLMSFYGNRRPRLLVALCSLSVLLAACTFEVQPIEQYTTADGYLSFEYPVAWEVLAEDTSEVSTGVVVASGPGIQPAGADSIPAGEAWIQIGLAPIGAAGDGAEAGALTAEKARALLAPPTVESPAGVSEITLEPLASGQPAYTYAVPTDSYRMSITLFEPADQTLATVVVVTAHGEDDPTLLAEISGIVNSIRFRGNASDFADRARAIQADSQ